jgi:hypothetical protein
MDERGDVDLDGDRRPRGGFAGRRDQQGIREVVCDQNLPKKWPFSVRGILHRSHLPPETSKRDCRGLTGL